jgi:succinyl-CoA synthetase alpha subunit
MVGEIGGDEEEKAAACIEAELTKPVVAYIAGFTAPPGKTMGHAGAIISGSSGTAEAKKAALEAKGIRVGTTPTLPSLKNDAGMMPTLALPGDRMPGQLGPTSRVPVRCRCV